MQLQSNLAILLEFELDRLLAVQSDVTVLISKRVRELIDKTKEIHDNYSEMNNLDENGGRGSVEILGNGSDTQQVDEDEDSEDFILTQLDQHAKEKLWTHENEELVTLRAELPKADISSPLKESQSQPDSYDRIKVNSKKHNVDSEVDKLPPTNKTDDENRTANNKEGLNVVKRLCIRSPNVGSTFPRTNLNINPLTGKPWILEDFKRNEDINSVKKGQKNLRIQKFYAEGCPPPEIGRQSLIDKASFEVPEDNSCEFENLRDRSHSPPGFGRLDFPNTQERLDDKQKSQNIIFHKTKWRFRKATSHAIPPYEREFLFKNDRLNEIIDNGTFEWNDAELQIYMRN